MASLPGPMTRAASASASMDTAAYRRAVDQQRDGLRDSARAVRLACVCGLICRSVGVCRRGNGRGTARVMLASRLSVADGDFHRAPVGQRHPG